jgi:hypothetical protein
MWLLVLSNPHLIDFLKSMTLRSGLILNIAVGVY